jgi:hypothetical protein
MAQICETEEMLSLFSSAAFTEMLHRQDIVLWEVI